MTTLKDLSQHLNLSITQISRALNDHDDVSQSTKKRVKEAAKLLNYNVNLSAKRLVTGRSGIVALVVDQDANVLEPQLFTQMIWGLSRAFSDLGRQFILHASRADGEVRHEYEALIDGAGVDGFVITEPVAEDPRIAFLKERKMPFVVHGRLPEVENYAFYDIDNFEVGRVLTQHLIDHGHRRIAFLNGVADRTYVEARRKGHLAALEGAGIAFDSSIYVNQEKSEANGLVSSISLFSNDKNRPTAIVCGNTALAKGVYNGLKALGLRVPDDVSIVAHDDLLPGLEANTFVPYLTSTQAPLSNSWAPMAKLLCDAIDGVDMKSVQMIEPFEMKVRRSVLQL